METWTVLVNEPIEEQYFPVEYEKRVVTLIPKEKYEKATTLLRQTLHVLRFHQPSLEREIREFLDEK